MGDTWGLKVEGLSFKVGHYQLSGLVFAHFGHFGSNFKVVCRTNSSHILLPCKLAIDSVDHKAPETG